MDILTTEQKAKRYDEAIEKLRSLHDDYDTVSTLIDIKEELENIFPELAETDDERIRRVIRGWIYTRPASFFDNGISKEVMLAWLEKQGEQNLIMAKSAQLGEQKSTDKIGPKFKIWDWVVSGQFVTQIREIAGDGYVNSHNGFIPFESAKNYHLWTIQDAKDGDVLVCNINKAEIGGDIEKLPNITPTICIYQNVVKDKEYIHTYCSLYNGSSLILSNSMYYNTFVYNIHPATKEQRDLLFKKMKEKGYEWDSEKKELKKLSQSEVIKTSDQEEGIIEIPFGAKDSELQEAIYNIPKGFHAEIDNDKVVIKKGEKPTAWSDEDERNMQNIDSVLFYDKTLPEDTCVKLRNFLKTLKDRVGCEANCTTTKEWSKEDEQHIDSLLKRLDGLCRNEFERTRFAISEDKDWLKSLRPQKQWKTSDEQMGVIEAVINNRSFQRRHLDSLYELLKKLKGE